jgi:antitoxin ParD1/3/4
MDIELRPETEAMIAEKLRAGKYSTPDDVVRAGLELLDDAERASNVELQSVRRKIAVGIEQLDRGEGLDGDAVFEALLAELGESGDAR